MQGHIIELDCQRRLRERLGQAKWAYTTRRVPREAASVLLPGGAAPRVGDLVLAKVVRLGQHKHLELANGRKARLFAGDEIVVVFGNRYAPDQFEAVIPNALGPCHLVAAGGVVAGMTFKNAAVKAPTAIETLGLLADTDGRPVNLADHALPRAPHGQRPRPPVIAVVGSSMNAGKTTTAAHLVRGLSAAGLAVGAAKVTGTGAGGDTWFLQDAGAASVLDFVDAGVPSTYRLSAGEVKEVFTTIVDQLNRPGTDVIVLEVADGLLQGETAALVSSDLFAHLVDGVLFAGADALAAVYGLERLWQWGVRVFAVSGLITRSPLAVRELMDQADIPVLTPDVLERPAAKGFLNEWLGGAGRAARRAGVRA